MRCNTVFEVNPASIITDSNRFETIRNFQQQNFFYTHFKVNEFQILAGKKIADTR